MHEAGARWTQRSCTVYLQTVSIKRINMLKMFQIQNYIKYSLEMSSFSMTSQLRHIPQTILPPREFQTQIFALMKYFVQQRI